MEIISDEVAGSGARKHTVYRIKGNDSNGDIDVTRRFKEFHLFREVLFENYPGLYIPPVPPKQATGNKQESFVAERRYFLNEFLKQISNSPHLASMPEV